MPRAYGTTGFYSAATPPVGVAGATYYDTALRIAYQSDGTRWMEISGDYIASRGPGLVTNGSALLGTNYNFATNYNLVKADHPVGAAGSFETKTPTPGAGLVDEFIPVDPAGFYDMTFAYRQAAGDVTRRFYSLIAPYDVDRLPISPQMYMEQANTRTTLAADLLVGATTITLTSSSNWNNAAGGNTHFRTVTIWNYVDGQGYAWPAGVYSRSSRLDAYADGGISGNVVTLRTPWTGLAAPAGTPISNGSSGGVYMYGASNVLAPIVWTDYRSRVGGVHTNLQLSATTAFPQATSYIKVGFLHNYPSGATDPTAIARVSNVNLVQVSATQAITTVGGDLTGTLPNPGIAAGVIVDADVNAAAAIAQSKISGLVTALTGKITAGALAIVDADVSASAAIAQSKISGLVTALTGKITAGAAAIVDADVSAAAAIAQSKISGLVTALAGKESTITAGTTAQYYRGDKSFQILDKTAVGLASVDNTTDVAKPISTATKAYVDAQTFPTLVEIPAVSDLNTYTVPGQYVQTTSVEAAAGTNYPVPNAGLLEVAANFNGTMVWQRYWLYGGNNWIYYRTYYNGTWYPWHQLSEDSVWVNMTPVSGTGVCKYRVVNGTVFVSISLTGMTSVAAGASASVVTVANGIPAAYRPASGIYGVTNMGGATVGLLAIQTDGSINMWNSSSVAVTVVRCGYSWPKE